MTLRYVEVSLGSLLLYLEWIKIIDWYLICKLTKIKQFHKWTSHNQSTLALIHSRTLWGTPISAWPIMSYIYIMSVWESAIPNCSSQWFIMKWTGHLDSGMRTLNLILGLASAQFQLSTEAGVLATDPNHGYDQGWYFSQLKLKKQDRQLKLA